MSCILFAPYDLAGLKLANRVIMAPMTRARTPGNVPTADMATYYAQRASAGPIITESAQVSRQGCGYLCTPGMHSAAQVAGWCRVTDAVHAAGGRMAAQLWHVGRVSHVSLQDGGALPVGPMTVAAADTRVQAYDAHGRPAQVLASPPVALDAAGIRAVIADFRRAARNAVAAGFDGVEIHAGNGFLFEQFINGGLNQRSDAWGGPPIANRLRLLLETVDAVADEIGASRIGVRISPFAHLGDLQPFADEASTWLALAEALQARNIAWVHGSHMGTPAFQRAFRAAWRGTLMLAGGFDAHKRARGAGRRHGRPGGVRPPLYRQPRLRRTHPKRMAAGPGRA